MMRIIIIAVSLLCLTHGKLANPFLSWGSSRIVDGEVVKPNSIPYQVGLHIRLPGYYKNFCGGSLISRNYVLTAAHCVDGMKIIEVVLGAHHVKENEDTQVRMVTSEFKMHQGWDPSIGQHDLALVKLPRPAPINKFIQLVRLPSVSESSKTFLNWHARATGWGDYGDGVSEANPVLRQVDLKIISNEQCNIAFPGSIQEGQICAAGDGRKGPCSGDSGGPLVVDGNKQVGVASFVIDLGCEAGYPAGYCRVSRYVDWIAANSDVKIEW